MRWGVTTLFDGSAFDVGPEQRVLCLSAPDIAPDTARDTAQAVPETLPVVPPKILRSSCSKLDAIMRLCSFCELSFGRITLYKRTRRCILQRSDSELVTTLKAKGWTFVNQQGGSCGSEGCNTPETRHQKDVQGAACSRRRTRTFDAARSSLQSG